ncbi:hypothetical protein OAN41_05160, partial [Candidatus Pelagibacter sp.]|nr:hypothetical protein [Candidatus Pelagibacter sp.]
NAALLFDPYSIESIRDKIILILYDDKLRSSIISEGFKQVKKFTWKECAMKTYEIYKKIL